MAKTKGTQQQWIIKDGEGRIFGPFNIEQLFKQIDSGFIQGHELVALYPGGQWISISKSPEFYDRLLDVLSSEAKPAPAPREKKTSERKPLSPQNPSPGSSEEGDTGDEVTVTDVAIDDAGFNAGGFATNGPAGAPGTEPGLFNGAAGAIPPGDSASIRAVPPPLEMSRARIAPPVAPVIELSDLKELERKERQKQSKLPFFLLFAAALIGATAFLFMPEERSSTITSNRVRLLAPRKNQKALPAAKIAEKYQRARGAFENDTFSSYQKAQSELVQVLEGMPVGADFRAARAESLALLCMTYRELWPFSFQDATDINTLSLIKQEARSADPSGAKGATCEVIQYLLAGRYAEAQTLTENTLVEDAQAPVLFEVRGEIYAYAGDPTNALTYFNQAKLQWPAWQKILIQEARVLVKKGQFSQALELYEGVLKKVPSHVIAKTELAMLEFNQFNHLDRAMELWQAVLNSEERKSKPTEAKALIGLALISEKKGLEKRALEYAQKAFSADPLNKDAKELVRRLGGETSIGDKKISGQERVYLGDQYVRAGDYLAAQAEYRAAYEADSRNAVAAMKAGRCLWQLNQSAEAIEYMKKAIAADAKLTPAYVQLADYHAQRFDYQAAAQVLRKIQGIQPSSYEVFRGYASLELGRGNNQGAVSFAQKALKLYENDVETLLIVAKGLMNQRDFQNAKSFAARAIELENSNTEAHAVFAKITVGLQGVDAGANYLQQMVNRLVITQGQQVPPAAIDYRVALGEIYFQGERYGLAIDVLKQAISLDRHNKKAMLVLGKTLQAENRVNEALETLLNAAVLDPSDADPIYLSGLLYDQAGKYDEAKHQFERVLKINPLYPRVHVQIGKVYLNQKDYKRALDEAALERAANPELVDTYLLAAEAYFGAKQYSNCAAEYQQATKRTRSAGLLVRMARCYRLSGATESAESILRQALSLESGNADLYKEYGAIYHVKGMASEAVTAYETYLNLAPNAADRGQIEEKMRKVRAGDLQLSD